MRKLNHRLRPRLSRGVVVVAVVMLAAIVGAGTVLADPGLVGNPWPYNAPVTPALRSGTPTSSNSLNTVTLTT